MAWELNLSNAWLVFTYFVSGFFLLKGSRAVFRWVRARLRARLRASNCARIPIQQSSPLAQLPVEILLCVVDHLGESPESTVALALTCKPLFASFGHKVTSLRGANRLALLTHIEKDAGDRLVYCPVTCRLHRFEKSWSPLHKGECGLRLEPQAAPPLPLLLLR